MPTEEIPMVRHLYRFPLLLLVSAVPGIIALGAVALGQDDWDVDEPVLVQPGMVQAAAFEVPEETFDQWVFGGKSTSQVTKRLDSLLLLQVASVERACELSEAQKNKLQLAARGDVKRFLGSVEEMRRKFCEVRRDQQRFNNIWQEIQPLQLKLNAGLFDETSLFRKVLKRTLDPEQSERFEQQERERQRFRYEAKIELAVATMEAGVPLLDVQRQKLVKVLREETEPPTKFGQYDYYVVLYKAAKIPKEKLQPIFDEGQWRAMTQLFAHGKSMEVTLKKHGFVP